MSEELTKEFMDVVERGDESAAKDFLVSHWDGLSEDVRNAVTSAFFSEGLDEGHEKADRAKIIIEKGTAALEDIAKQETGLEKQKTLSDIKESL